MEAVSFARVCSLLASHGIAVSESSRGSKATLSTWANRAQSLGSRVKVAANFMRLCVFKQVFVLVSL